jgi:integrase/recombinase XerD
MNTNLQSWLPFVRKTLRSLEKLLATKLAILFQKISQGSRTMRSSSASEPSLFGTNGSRKYLTAQEQRRFRKAIKKLPFDQRLFCSALFFSGGRISEILSLTPAGINVENCILTLRTLKRRKLAIRQIPLPRPVILEIVRLSKAGRFMRDPTNGDGRLWPWSRTTGWRIVKEAMKEAHIAGPPASPKGLRHTFGVSAFQAKVPPHLVQRWLGHASLRTTAIYAEVIGKEERLFASRMWDSRSGDP